MLPHSRACASVSPSAISGGNLSLSWLSLCPNKHLTPSLNSLLSAVSPQLLHCFSPHLPTFLSPLTPSLLPHHKQLKFRCPSTSPGPICLLSPPAPGPSHQGSGDGTPVPARDAPLPPSLMRKRGDGTTVSSTIPVCHFWVLLQTSSLDFCLNAAPGTAQIPARCPSSLVYRGEPRRQDETELQSWAASGTPS